MAEPGILRDLVIIFAVAVAAVALLRRLGVPTIAGFILAGMLIGPRSLGLVHEVAQVDTLAEVGVVLLLFGIGLELPLDRIKRIWRPVLLGGALQVSLSVAAVLGLALLFGMSWSSALMLGFIISVSSTAIVLRGLDERGELGAPHGRLTLGILIFQDLCVLPMMLSIPLLSGSGGVTESLVTTLLTSLGMLIVVVLSASLIVPRALALVARTRQRELFLLTVFMVCVGTAWLAARTGVSLALGAFLAGLVVAGSEFRHQAMHELIPFREVLSSVFFVSVGMLIAPAEAWRDLGPILLLLAAILVGKGLVVFAVGSLLRLPLSVSVLSAAALCQVGEFSFVLSRAAHDSGLLDSALLDRLLAAVILSMLVTPFMLRFGPFLVTGAVRLRPLARMLEVQTAIESGVQQQGWSNHVIIAGYGVTGEALAKELAKCGVRYVIVDLNADNIQRATGRGEPAYYGDAARPEVLKAVGAEHAQDLVVAINNPTAALNAVRAARALSDELHIVVRARYLDEVAAFEAAGANKVIPAELEAALQITSHLMTRTCAYDTAEIDRLTAEIRKAHE